MQDRTAEFTCEEVYDLTGLARAGYQEYGRGCILRDQGSEGQGTQYLTLDGLKREKPLAIFENWPRLKKTVKHYDLRTHFILVDIDTDNYIFSYTMQRVERGQLPTDEIIRMPVVENLLRSFGNSMLRNAQTFYASQGRGLLFVPNESLLDSTIQLKYVPQTAAHEAIPDGPDGQRLDALMNAYDPQTEFVIFLELGQHSGWVSAVINRQKPQSGVPRRKRTGYSPDCPAGRLLLLGVGSRRKRRGMDPQGFKPEMR